MTLSVIKQKKMDYDDIEEFDVMTEERVAEVKEEVDFTISNLQITSAMLLDLQRKHVERNQLRKKVDSIACEKKRDMESIHISDSKKRKVLEDALTKYYVGERRDVEETLRDLNESISMLDQDVRSRPFLNNIF